MPDITRLTGEVTVRGLTASTGNALIVQNSTPTNLLTVGNDGLLTLLNNVTFTTTGAIKITVDISSTFRIGNAADNRYMQFNVNDQTLDVRGNQTGNGFILANRLTSTVAATSYVAPDGIYAVGSASITPYDSAGNIALNCSNNGNRSIALKGLGSSGSVLIGAISTSNGTTYSSILTVASTTQGFLQPRMTTAQRNTINTPSTGLSVYDTTNNVHSIYNGSAWVDLVSTSNYEGLNIAFGTITGTKIGTATGQKLAFWNKTPVAQPTTAITGATVVAVGGTNIQTNDTFGGYTMAQVVQALINVGILA